MNTHVRYNKRHLLKTLEKIELESSSPLHLSITFTYLTSCDKALVDINCKVQWNAKISQRKGDLSWKHLTNSYMTGCYSSATVSGWTTMHFKYCEELTHVNSNSLSKKYEWLIVKRCDGSVSLTYRFQTCPGVGDLPRRRPTRAPILGVAAPPGLPTTYPESPTPRPKKPRLGRWDDLPRDPVLPGTVLGWGDRRPYAPPPNHGV